MEEESASYERVHLHIQPNSLFKDRAKYIARVATRMVTSSVEFFSHSHGNPADVFSTIFA